jgi:UDPglucose 6-dehydrogenase
MRVTMIGTGYVGLVSGTCFADFGHHVVCVDKDAGKIEGLKAAKIPIFEPGLNALVEKNAREGRLSFTTDLSEALEGADAVFIAVGTPSRRGDGHADLSYVYAAADEIARTIKHDTVLVTKSTVPIGTGDEVERILRATNPERTIPVVSNPEFLREGAAIEDFKRPDRIVIGTEDAEARAIMSELYEPLANEGAQLVFVSRRTSELIKYSANAFLAMKISFINEMADLCEVVDADVKEVARGIGMDQRIGKAFLQAGPGYGGSCFPKDTLALMRTAEENSIPLSLVRTTIEVNDRRKNTLVSKVEKATGGDLKGKTVAVLGLTFKANTDDLRDSPALSLIESLLEKGANIQSFDPEGIEGAKELFKGKEVKFASNPYEAAQGADVLALVTEWDAFRALDLPRLKKALKSPVFVDFRNIYDGKTLRKLGFTYVGVGRGRSEIEG